jgi:hypothetical protein
MKQPKLKKVHYEIAQAQNGASSKRPKAQNGPCSEQLIALNGPRHRMAQVQIFAGYILIMGYFGPWAISYYTGIS